MSSNFSRPEFLGRLRTPKTMKIIAGVTSAAAIAPGLPTIDSDDLGKLRTALLDKTELRRFKRSSGNASRYVPAYSGPDTFAPSLTLKARRLRSIAPLLRQPSRFHQ